MVIRRRDWGRESKKGVSYFLFAGVPPSILMASLLSPLTYSWSTVTQKKNKGLLAVYANMQAETINNTGFKIAVKQFPIWKWSCREW